MSSKSLYLNEFDQILRKYKVSEWTLPQKMISWDISRVTDFVFDAYSSLREEPNKSNSAFAFAANVSLSGGPFPCSSLECRFNNLDSLSRFTALYADRVYIANPFEKYVFMPEIIESRFPSLVDDVVAFLYSRPLFDAGLFSVRNNISGFGDICLEYTDSLAIGVQKKIRKAEKQLCTRYLDDVKFEINNWGGEIFLSVSGTENLIEHGAVDIAQGLPKNLVDKYEKGFPRRLTKKEIKDNNIFGQFISPVLTDLFELNLHVVTRKTNYLSNRSLDFELMSQIGDASSLERNRAIMNGISHSVPDIINVPVDKLLELRKKEGDSFDVYRDKLSKVLKQSEKLKTEEIIELINDEIKPQLRLVERTIKNAKKLLTASLFREIIVSSAYVGVGVFSGFLSPKVGELVTTLGGLSFARTLIEKSVKVMSIPESVVANPYYFLWKTTKR